MPGTIFTRQGPAAVGTGATGGTAGGPTLHALTQTEWLLTNGQGGFAMGTASGIPTRRYHGLLVASLRPPVNRIMALSAISETLTLDTSGLRFDLANFNFSPSFVHPTGYQYLVSFEKDVRTSSVRWTFKVSGVEVVKTLHLPRHTAAALIGYTVRNSTGKPVTLTLAPLLALRDFHALLLRDLNPNRFTVTPWGSNGVAVSAQGSTLSLGCAAPFTPDGNWWYNFAYPIEANRGYDHLEDLFSPGHFTHTAPPGESTCTLRAVLGPSNTLPTITLAQSETDAAARHDAILKATRLTLGPAFFAGGPLEHHRILSALPSLVAAADAFVIRRVRPGAIDNAPADRVSIIAGYPWFADWGRDSMISLPGLLLACGRFSEARAVLETFAAACKEGLIPNVFDDYTGTPHYNTVDAALWFVHAATQYLADSGDAETFNTTLLPACLEIIERYSKGTLFGIKMDDADGLVRAGDETTQLTWMDAKRDGVVFTPRHGKPVEINALWYNALCATAQAVRSSRPADAARLTHLAERVANSFCARFWNPQRGCLFDVIDEQGNGTAEIRPNQLFAVSLPHSPLTQQQMRSVVDVCTQTLYTPLGVRTLEPGDWRYKGRFRGRMFDRDAAYHNGTAWPWLLGPLAEATARADGFSPDSIKRAKQLLAPTLASLDADCFGQIPEVYDGDNTDTEPQQPGACPAQAWSVAELLRVSIALARAEA